jgi:hypothetical protein
MGLLAVGCTLLAIQGDGLGVLTWVEHLVEKLDSLLGAKLDGTYAGTDEPLLHDRDTLLEL